MMCALWARHVAQNIGFVTPSGDSAETNAANSMCIMQREWMEKTVFCKTFGSSAVCGAAVAAANVPATFTSAST